MVAHEAFTGWLHRGHAHGKRRSPRGTFWNCLEKFFGVEQLVVYIDIRAARGTLVRGRTDSTIAEKCLDVAPGKQHSRYERVPPHSNLSDGPSWLEFSFLILASAS